MDAAQEMLKKFDEHENRDDGRFKEISTGIAGIQAMLTGIESRLENMEVKLDQHEISIKTLTDKMETLMKLYNGFQFGRSAILWTAGVVGGIGVIITAIMTVIRSA